MGSLSPGRTSGLHPWVVLLVGWLSFRQRRLGGVPGLAGGGCRPREGLAGAVQQGICGVGSSIPCTGAGVDSREGVWIAGRVWILGGVWV